ncbi:MAG: cell surface protein [Labilithrix sp.]|nr:cell surface protein [Labilithrix sp.]MCW5809716.1 cell surface protein [Labilithrix sp.]
MARPALAEGGDADAVSRALAVLTAGGLLVFACSSGDGDAPAVPADAGPAIDFGAPTVKKDGGASSSSSTSSSGSADASFEDGGVLDDVPPFITKVVSFTPGRCSGFGATQMPGIVMGPPKGAGTAAGSFDVVSLGKGGEIVVSLEPNAIVDGEGADFVVFENAFIAAGSTEVFVEPGEVSVSDDGETWKTFPCTATQAPWGACAGSHPVMEDGTGGDPYDLADVGLTRARFVRIVDKTVSGICNSQGPNNYGFDLDAIQALHF